MKLFTAIFAFLVVFQSSINTTETVSKENRNITVTVPNVTSNKGTIHYALYNEKGFMIQPLKTQSSKITNKKSTVVFTDVAPGEYAIICFHDLNGNDKMDFDEGRMPLEDYGISNNPASFGPPQYDTAKFVVSDKDVTLEIRF